MRRPQRLFESAVDHYARYRTSYPPEDVHRLAQRLDLRSGSTVVDIGCGTGQFTIPLARHAGQLIAIDPLSEMLAIGRRDARAAGRTNISWCVGDSEALASVISPGAQVATFAGSFHWTDRPGVVQLLDGLLDDRGAIVIINDDLDEDEDPLWAQAVTAVRRRYLGDSRTVATDTFTEAPVSHREVLERSPFADVQSLFWSWERQLTVDEAVGLQFTYSFSTPASFGARAPDFAAEARAAILALHPDGLVVEPFRMEVLIASRPPSRITELRAADAP